jgi:hypothetical protein
LEYTAAERHIIGEVKMTKVEELRAILISYLVAEGCNEKYCAEEVDALISASHAEGVAEGFEQGVIAGVTEYKTRLEAELRKVSHIERRGFEFGKETQVFVTPASVLVPKEQP